VSYDHEVALKVEVARAKARTDKLLQREEQNRDISHGNYTSRGEGSAAGVVLGPAKKHDSTASELQLEALNIQLEEVQESVIGHRKNRKKEPLVWEVETNLTFRKAQP